jgi:hypothetical protein
MALRCNGNQFASSGVYHAGATVVLSAYPPVLQGNFSQTGRIRNLTAGQGITSDYVGIPMGYVAKGWMMPQKAGFLSSRSAALGLDATGAMLSGVTADAPATFGIDTNTPDGQLVSTVQPGGAPATFGVDTNTPELTASLSGVGSSDIGFSVADALLGALGGMTVTADFGIDGTLTSYAVGHMEGTTADTGVTVDNIVTALESAILPVNIVKVNDYAVTGAGQSGNEWGPV